MLRQKYLVLAFVTLFWAAVLSIATAQASDDLPAQGSPTTAVASPAPASTGRPAVMPAATPVSPLLTDAPAPLNLTAGVLDNFNRANGPLGSNWSGNTAGYAIVSNELDVGADEDIYWNAALFGTDQEAYVTLASIDPAAEEIGLILKAQSSSGTSAGLINVTYKPVGNFESVQVWTYSGAQGWQQRGSAIPVTFVDGDQLGARATDDGKVAVYRNGTMLAIRDVTDWPFFADTGYIGLLNVDAATVILDDFGGGNSNGILPTPSPTPTTCTDPLTCDPVTSVPAYWRCNTPTCIGNDWLGSVINWPSDAAFSSNNRSGNNSRTVYAIADNQPQYAYMEDWADGCEITGVAGVVLIIEWERGTDVWRETYLNPGESHTIDLVAPENNVMIESPEGFVEPFAVSLNNCSPTPLALGLSAFGKIEAAPGPIALLTLLVLTIALFGTALVVKRQPRRSSAQR